MMHGQKNIRMYWVTSRYHILERITATRPLLLTLCKTNFITYVHVAWTRFCHFQVTFLPLNYKILYKIKICISKLIS